MCKNANIFQKIDAVIESTAYLCYANSSFGSVEYVFLVEIEKSPTLIASAVETQTINLNDDFLLECAIDAMPEVNISWYRNEKLLANSSMYGKIANNIFLTPKGNFLRVTNAQISSFGEYKCMATNHLGTVERKFHIEYAATWSEWSAWSICSRNCSNQRQFRKRHCVIRNSMLAADRCVGSDTEIKKCTRIACTSNRVPDTKPVNRNNSDGDSPKQPTNLTVIVTMESQRRIEPGVTSLTLNFDTDTNFW